MENEMRVQKRTVEVFDVLDRRLDRSEAMKVYEELAKALGVPAFKRTDCGDPMSHGAHWHGAGARLYCGGHAFDRT